MSKEHPPPQSLTSTDNLRLFKNSFTVFRFAAILRDVNIAVRQPVVDYIVDNAVKVGCWWDDEMNMFIEV